MLQRIQSAGKGPAPEDLKMKTLTVALGAVLMFAGVAKADQHERELANRDLANAMIACQAQVAEVVTGHSVEVMHVDVTNLNDLDAYELVFGRNPHSPMSRPHGTAVLKISRTFQPFHCPEGAMDCGGGRYVYDCKLRKHQEQDETRGCTRDFGRYGWPSSCFCPDGQAWDERVGSCFVRE